MFYDSADIILVGLVPLEENLLIHYYYWTNCVQILLIQAFFINSRVWSYCGYSLTELLSAFLVQGVGIVCYYFDLSVAFTGSMQYNTNTEIRQQ